MKVTYLGTTTLLFDDGKDQLMFDCHITRPSMSKFVIGKICTDEELADKIIEKFHIERLKAIFVSHSHYDHVLDAPYFAVKSGADIYGSESTVNVAIGGNVPEQKIHLFDINREEIIGNYRIKIIPSIHSKAHWYNDDLEQIIDEPVIQPASKAKYKEGGSYDFLIENQERKYLIRPSFNYIEGQLDDIKADVLFLGIAGLSKADEATENKFFEETVEKVRPELVVPVHWDNFMSSLEKPIKGMPKFAEDTAKSMFKLAEYCGENGISCIVQLPMTSFNC